MYKLRQLLDKLKSNFKTLKKLLSLNKPPPPKSYYKHVFMPRHLKRKSVDKF